MKTRFARFVRLGLLLLVGVIPLAFSGGSVMADASTFQSDNFNTCNIKPQWGSFINPLGDGSFSTNGTTVSISVPQSKNDHDNWVTNGVVAINAPRFMMPVTANSANFGIVVKMNSAVSAKYQTQGILIQQDANNLLRFEFYGDGINTYMFAGKITGVVNPTTYYRLQIGPINVSPLYMKIVRANGNQWTQSYSMDGTTWTPGPTNPITTSLTVTSIGFYGGNTVEHTGIDTAPAHTAIFDYFSNTDALAPADGPINCTVGPLSKKVFLPLLTR